MSNGIAAAPTARIPAWKRLGLKLKYAKETADLPNDSREEQQNGQRCSTPGHEDGIPQSTENSRPAKKRKTSPESQQLPPGQPDPCNPHGVTSHLPSTSKIFSDEEEKQVTSPEQSMPRARQKSVTFTEDTKQEDGISAKSLTGKPRKADAFEAVTESTEPASLSPKKDKKKRKREQPEKPAISESTEKPPYLEYLERFESDRENWKFNKHNQSNLLKHMFDIKRIPTSYNKSIANYLSGLQGIEARERLIQSATDILKGIAEKEESGAEIEEMESAQARRDAYAASLRRQIERVERYGLSEHDQHDLEDMRNEIERGRRAEEILSQMLQQRSGSAEMTPRATTGSTNGMKSSSTSSKAPTIGTASQGTASITSSRRKKRKTRTQGSSSDDSSSDGESDKRAAARPKIENIVTKATYGTARGEPKVFQPLEKIATGKKVIFDDALLDEMFPKPKVASAAASLRRDAVNGNRAPSGSSDSGSESGTDSSDSESDSESDSDSE